MCGRYALTATPEDILHFLSVIDIEDFPARFNIAPTQPILIVAAEEHHRPGSNLPPRRALLARWGFIPGWVKDVRDFPLLINARAETAHEKASFRGSLRTRRCILPADGYYEWVTGRDERQEEEKGKRKRPRKQPYFVTPADGSVMALAGLYEFWRDRTLPDDHPEAWWVTCSVITTEAETEPFAGADGKAGDEGGPRSLADIHPRMPLVLTPDRWDAWLDPARTDAEQVRGLLAPPPAGALRAYPVGSGVSNVRNNGPELLEELDGPEAGTLF